MPSTLLLVYSFCCWGCRCDTVLLVYFDVALNFSLVGGQMLRQPRKWTTFTIFSSRLVSPHQFHASKYVWRPTAPLDVCMKAHRSARGSPLLLLLVTKQLNKIWQPADIHNWLVFFFDHLLTLGWSSKSDVRFLCWRLLFCPRLSIPTLSCVFAPRQETHTDSRIISRTRRATPSRTCRTRISRTSSTGEERRRLRKKCRSRSACLSKNETVMEPFHNYRVAWGP